MTILCAASQKISSSASTTKRRIRPAADRGYGCCCYLRTTRTASLRVFDQRRRRYYRYGAGQFFHKSWARFSPSTGSENPSTNNAAKFSFVCTARRIHAASEKVCILLSTDDEGSKGRDTKREKGQMSSERRLPPNGPSVFFFIKMRRGIR